MRLVVEMFLLFHRVLFEHLLELFLVNCAAAILIELSQKHRHLDTWRVYTFKDVKEKLRDCKLHSRNITKVEGSSISTSKKATSLEEDK